MRKPVFLFSIIAFLSLFISSCSRMDLAGVSATKCQDITEWYNSIVVDGNIIVEQSGDEGMIEIATDANVLPYVEAYVRSGTLVVEYDDGARFSGRFETHVRIPSSARVQSIRLMNAAEFRTGQLVEANLLSLEASSASFFNFAGISADEIKLNLGDASLFMADRVDASTAVLTLCDASAAMMDGTVMRCRAVMEDASSLSPRTESYVDHYALEIVDFEGNLSDASSASFHSNGSISGFITDGSSIFYTSDIEIVQSVTVTDGSEIVREGF